MVGITEKQIFWFIVGLYWMDDRRLFDGKGFQEKTFLSFRNHENTVRKFGALSPVEKCYAIYVHVNRSVSADEAYDRNEETRMLLLRLEELWILKKGKYMPQECFEIRGLKPQKLTALYFDILNAQTPKKEFFMYPPIVLRRLERVLADLNMDMGSFREIYQEALGEIPEGSNMHFELVLLNFDKKYARVRILSFLKSIRKHFGLILKNDTSLRSELDEIEKEIDNEIIDLHFRDFQYRYNPVEKKGDCTLRDESISWLLDQFHNKGKSHKKSSTEIAAERDSRNSLFEKEKNAVISVLYAILKYAEESGEYQGGDILRLNAEREILIGKILECKLIGSRIKRAWEPGKALKERFRHASNALKNLNADFEIRYPSDLSTVFIEIGLIRHSKMEDVTACDMK